MKENEKITINTELDTWYGITKLGDRVAITEISLLELTSQLANVENVELANVGKVLFKQAKSDNYIEMHDGTKLVKNIKEALDHGMIEIAQDLLESSRIQNKNNGFADPDPMTE